MKIHPFGDRAWLVDLGLPVHERAARSLAAAEALRASLPSVDVALGAGSLLLDGLAPGMDLAPLLAVAEQTARRPLAPTDAPAITIEVVYDGPDLPAVAAQLGMDIPDVVRLHTSPRYHVELLGFLPGFAYLGPAPAPLALPRRATPRPVVPARSVGVAAGFTGVYPSATPGGWHLLGSAPGFTAFSSQDGRPALVPGGTVRFVAVEVASAATTAAGSSSAAPAGEPVLRVLAAPACATIQDGGRRGSLALGLPPSGPLDPDAHAAANRAAGNEGSTAAIEIPQGSLEVEAMADCWLAIDGEQARRLRSGERLRVASGERAVRYLAVEGGLGGARVLGSRATLPSARLGGMAGRPLRRGDVIPRGDEGTTEARGDVPRGAGMAAAQGLSTPERPARLQVHPGPHLDRFHPEVLDILLREEFAVSRLGDRVGVRLDGPRLPSRAGRLDLPVPMVRGAIEVATDGVPIVLGPDHPVTGGYPVVGVLTAAAQVTLARLWPGHPVRFALAPSAG